MIIRSHYLVPRNSLLITVKRIHTSLNSNWRVLFFGSDDFSIGPLKKLSELWINSSLISNLAVVSSAGPVYNKKLKRSILPPVLQYAEDHNIQTFAWPDMKNSKQIPDTFDLAIVASFGDFIPAEICHAMKKACLNIHPSLLPKYRGAAPIIHTILNGDEKTGFSVIDVSVDKFDRGKIWYQEEYTVPPDTFTESLTETLSEMSASMLPRLFEDFENMKLNAVPQEESQVSYATKISSKRRNIDFTNHSSHDIWRIYRALRCKMDGAMTSLDRKLVKLVDLNLSDNTEAPNVPPGTWIYKHHQCELLIKCKKGWISVSKLQMERKSTIKATDFYNAYLVDRGTGGARNVCFEPVPRIKGG